MIDQPIPMPADELNSELDPETDQPRALRLFVTHGFPEQRRGEVHFDELAIINWSPRTGLTVKETFPTPNAVEFLQVFAAPGPVELELRVRKYRPVISK